MDVQLNREDWLVKNLTVLGKLFLTLAIASLLSSGVARAQISVNDSVTGPFNPGNNSVSFIVNLLNYNGGLLSKEDKRIYLQSLMIMLDNVPLGNTVEWYSDVNPTVRGQMRVVYGYQTTNGYCRVYQSEVFKDGNVKSWQEYACRSLDKPQWIFYNK
jgi:surface antigen